jgi:predicted permease
MRWASFYRALLRCYPAAFREEYGGQMQLMFAEQLGEARRSGYPLRPLGLWLHAAMDAFTIAPQEHCHVIRQDVRYALRAMRAQPGFTAVAILSLALGIGANTAIFSLWNGILHSSLPGVRHPEQLVMLTDPESSGMWHGNTQGERPWLTVAEFQLLRGRLTSFSDLTAAQSSLGRWQVRFEGHDWEEARGRLVSDGYFDFFGVRPALGRVFTPGGDRADAPYAVLSYQYWQRRFAGRGNVLGRTITLRNAVLTVIGVAAPDFAGETAAQQPDLWVPLTMQPAVLPGENWLRETPPQKVMWLHAFGRIKPGVTLKRAEAETNSVFQGGLESFYGNAPSPERRRQMLNQFLKLHPGAQGASETRGDFSTSLSVLLAAVGLLLLIACANLANLLLARGAGRRPEMALRLSLGASRGRLVRLLVTESLVLAVIGGLAGLGAAVLMHGTLVGMIVRSDRDFHMSFALDPLVLAFTIAVTLAAGILFGLLPAWQVTRADAGAVLNEQGRGGAPGRMRLGRGLVSLQLALSLPLLIGAGLLARTVYNLQHVELGYPTERLAMLGIDSRLAGYNSARSTVLYADLLDRIRHIPGVQAASFSHNGVFTGSNSGDPIEVEGYVPKGMDGLNSAWDMVGPDYFSTLGIPIVMGREILASDHAAAPKVCVINEELARKFFAGRNPVGLHLTAIDEAADGVHRTIYQVVGVARDVRTNGLRGTIGPRFYMPITQPSSDSVKRANFLIRTAPGRAGVLGAVRQTLRQVDGSLPIVYAHTMETQLDPWTAPNRTTAQVAEAFGGVALVLAAIGLYGVLSHGIARRRGEIAIRIALGAQPGRVIAMVLGETSVLVIVGLAVGGGLTWAALRWIASELFGVSPQDPLTLTLAVGLLLTVALAAVWLPAWKASRLDPMAALRHQ